MKIIGEKINGTRKKVAQAIATRDAAAIQDLAVKQTQAGAHWLDVNAGTLPAQEVDDLTWLIDTIQAVVDTPLCLDSANPDALRKVIGAVHKTPMINSISGEPERLAGILPIVVEHGCEVIALCMGSQGIPTTSSGRLEVIRKVFDETRCLGVPDEKVYVDPLVMTIATDTTMGRTIFDTMRGIREEFPQAHISCGLSNVSFGLPARSLVNRTFLVLSMQAGMDTAIIDPNDHELQAAMIAADLLLGNDKHCLRYTRSYRAGLLEKPAAGPVK